MSWALLVVLLPCVGAATPDDAAARGPVVRLKAWGVPSGTVGGAYGESMSRIMAAFQDRHPDVRLEPMTGITAIGAMDVLPLMQIAGEVSPDVIYVNFRQSDTYIQNRFLYPLDRYIEKTAGVQVPGGHLLSNEQYVERLRAGPGFARHLEERVPAQCWEVMRRPCPYADACPYLAQWGEAPAAVHRHAWSFPQGPLAMALFYRRDLFAENGLPDRVPETYDEMLAWARQVHNPKENVYGMFVWLTELGWSTMSVLYSYGGRIVDLDAGGQWACVFDSEEAVEAYLFVARVFVEPFENKHGRFTGVVYRGDPSDRTAQYAMRFSYVGQRYFEQMDLTQNGFGPVPKGPTGVRGSEFNSMMTGIYAGIEADRRKVDLAWEYMLFYNGVEAEAIQTEVFVRNGLAHYIRPSVLRRCGYEDYVSRVPGGWEEALVQAMQYGIPEPYGRNCQQAYRYVSMAINQIINDDGIKAAIEHGDTSAAKDRIRAVLHNRVALGNEKMLRIIPPEVRRFRTGVAVLVAVAIAAVFTWVFRRVFRTFSTSMPRSAADVARGDWQFARYRLAYLILLPALLSIGVWAYYPLARGMLMAFQDYNVRGFGHWTGLENFSTVLFSVEFWYSLWVSVKYTLLYVFFGFCTPIALAVLLTEVPQGKILYRTLYFLPAVLSGVVVVFLWKGFYGEYGMVNGVLNALGRVVTAVSGHEIAEVRTDWLAQPGWALLFCLLPVIWAGMGPGSLIYLAALKTIPEDLYEAADIDGAGILHKVWHITIPSIRALIVINFIGAVIGAMKSGSEFILAMTGGGPYAPYGVTEVVGLHIFWEAFGYLRFGIATSMAWILGSLLIGFTVMQLQRLSRMEFKAAGGTDATR